jgi:hypothetical protein
MVDDKPDLGNDAAPPAPRSECGGRAAGIVECPACRGTGKVLLLVSARPCEACGLCTTGRPPGTS